MLQRSGILVHRSGDKSYFAHLGASGEDQFLSDHLWQVSAICKRLGGKIGMANWTPEGFWGQTFGLQARYVPPPAGLRGAPEWGTEQRLRELFGDAVTSTQIERKSALFRFRSPQHWIEVFSTYFGPIMRTLEALDPERRRAYLADLDATLRRFNRSGDETLVVSADYLEVVMIKK